MWKPIEKYPLYEKTEDGIDLLINRPFIAAVPYHNNKTDEHLWWIRHCDVNDDNGELCVICNDDIEPAGWELEDVTHWMDVPLDPDKCITLYRDDLTYDKITKPIDQITLYDFKVWAITYDEICKAALIQFIDDDLTKIIKILKSKY